jgi:hypothetical protein
MFHSYISLPKGYTWLIGFINQRNWGRLPKIETSKTCFVLMHGAAAEFGSLMTG